MLKGDSARAGNCHLIVSNISGQLLTDCLLVRRKCVLLPVKPSSSPHLLQASVSRPSNISGIYYFPLQTNKTTLYFKCHRHPLFKIQISQFRGAAYEKNPLVFTCYCFPWITFALAGLCWCNWFPTLETHLMWLVWKCWKAFFYYCDA